MPLEFSAALQHDRKSLGMSQAEFAESLSVSQQTLSKWEAGTAMPRVNKLTELLKLIGDKLDGESETVKTIEQMEGFKFVDFKQAPEASKLASFLRMFQKWDDSESDVNIDPQVLTYFVNKLRDDTKQRRRIELVKALRNHSAENNKSDDPYALLSKASSDLGRASEAMEKASIAVAEATKLIREMEAKKAE